MKNTNGITHNGKMLAEWLVINKTENANLSGADLSRAVMFSGWKLVEK